MNLFYFQKELQYDILVDKRTLNLKKKNIADRFRMILKNTVFHFLKIKIN